MSNAAPGELTFLPYLRRGIGRHVDGADPGSGTIGPAAIELSFEVEGRPVTRNANLLAPHHVEVVDPAEVVRRWPTNGATDVETNYFPLIEFSAPDLPWRFSPAAPGTDGKLRPWLVLVVVEEGDGVAYSEASTSLGRLTVPADRLDQLPNPGETWAWAHVQSAVEFDAVAKTVDSDPAALRSRLVCPRWLEPDRTYRAAVVNAFAAGTEDASEPAWSVGGGEAVLDVHDTWTFTTAALDGDFESLCERLQRADDAGPLGVRPIDITAPGFEVDNPAEPVVVDLIGALADPDAIVHRAPPEADPFIAGAEPLLDETISRRADEPVPTPYDALRDDPVVGLPFYGAWPSEATEVPDGGWARNVNVRPDRRAAAGLGAKIVRRQQEALMAAAWDQLGDVRGAADELNRGRMAAEVGRTWLARVAEVEDGDRLAAAAPLLTFAEVDGGPAIAALRASSVPNAIADRAWLRRVPRARAASASTTYLSGVDAAFAFQDVRVPVGTSSIDPNLIEEIAAVVVESAVYEHAMQHSEPLGADRFLGRYLRTTPATELPDRPVQQPKWPAPQPLVAQTAVADSITELDPLLATRESLVSRVHGLDQILPVGELPAELSLTPEFTDPLFFDLAAFDTDVIVPGLGDFPLDRVRLLGVNPGFIGALLVGVNHAMAEEFRWREYPVDLTATFFRRFFDYHDPAQDDIAPIAGWDADSTLIQNVPNADTTTVILVRGDLIRRYPEVNIFIAVGSHDDDVIDEKTIRQPVFESNLTPDVRVVGFDLAPEVVTGVDGGDEYYVVFEERMVAPRFGLDVTRDTKLPLETWDELSRDDFVEATHIPATVIPNSTDPAPTLDEIEWGRNAAHSAAATHQRPYRKAFPASRLIEAETP